MQVVKHRANVNTAEDMFLAVQTDTSGPRASSSLTEIYSTRFYAPENIDPDTVAQNRGRRVYST